MIKKHDQSLLFCSSYTQVPIILSKINNLKKNFILVTDHKNIYFFFKKIFKKNQIILIKQSPSILSLNIFTIFQNLKKIENNKKKINIFFNKFINCNIFFFKGANLPQTSYVIKLLSLKNKIFFFYQHSHKALWIKKNPSFKIFVYQIFLKVFYGLSHDSLSDGRKILLFTSNSFYKNIKCKKIIVKLNIEYLKSIEQKFLKIKKSKVLLLSAHDAITSRLISLNNFKLFINRFINNQNKNRIFFKKKNSSEKKFFKEKILNEIPVYWPSNLILHRYKLVIGYHSATLFEAANAGCLSISLIDMLSDDPTSLIKFYQEYLKKNLKHGKKIYFPKTISELDRLMRQCSV